ncbi:uncharacterized protein B0I36DRAFT_99273 [Microdochium trichocladiopsis]|uniref:Zn(2)-C6 fungal-type domain-containing protein n=1 Tax=Microdochium trichocladiopsis TaxID=1682393 RepID=A0A9P9BR91_9PEZI|nr:uncharacterized protein B0I36DRAFT_99273 [Microdochium trichocladiopsis]KAH7032636.1 hypothetical protein B0I36DRAFT_99273 [Microdochium trichocladiopsis]
MPRRKLHSSVSLPKQPPDASHASLLASNSHMFSGHSSSFNAGLSGGIDVDFCFGLPSPPTPSPVNHLRLVETSSYNSSHPSTSDANVPLGDFLATWGVGCVDPSNPVGAFACATWPLDPGCHDTYVPQHLQNHEYPTGAHHPLAQNSQGVASFPAHQFGSLDSGHYPNSFYQVFSPEPAHSLGSDPSFLPRPMSSGAMDGSWVLEPEEPANTVEDVTHDLAVALDETSLPCRDYSEGSDDGVLVEIPSASVEPTVAHRSSLSPTATQTAGKGKKHTRSCLSPEGRMEAACTRRNGACVRCVMQKSKCRADPDNPLGGCLTCADVSLESKKVIHRLSCVRWKLSEVVMFRGDGLNLTSRWRGTAMKDLGPSDWVDNTPRILVWQLDHTPYPLQFVVKRFRPQPGDSVTRRWQDSKGRNRETRIEPFGLADIHRTAQDYMMYNYTNALLALDKVRNEMTGQVDEIVCRTYEEVSRRIVMTERPQGLGAKKVNPADFLHKYIKLWFGIRNSVGSAFITPGTDMLDMQPETHPDYPYGDKVSIPRMISEQFYNLQYEKLLVPVRRQILEELKQMMTGKEPEHFYTVYLTIFMLLYETSFASADRHRRAVQYDEPTYYSLPLFVENLQFSANILLLYWHYYKRDFNPLRMNWDSVKKKDPWSKLTLQQRGFLHGSWQYFADRAARPMEKLTWKDELYFVAQMFEDDWFVRPTYAGN